MEGHRGLRDINWGYLQAQGGYSSTLGGHIEKRREIGALGNLNEVTKGLNQVSWGLRYVNLGPWEVTWGLNEFT